MIHLFSREMGLPIRRYTLWLRLRDVFLSLAEGCSLTEAAHRAGFADSPHMSRTFRGMFGIPPSFFVDGRGVVRTEFIVNEQRPTSTHPLDVERWHKVARRRAKA